MAAPVLTYGSVDYWADWLMTKWVTNDWAISNEYSQLKLRLYEELKGAPLKVKIQMKRLGEYWMFVYSLNDKIQQGRLEWIRHAERMEGSGITKQVTSYRL